MSYYILRSASNVERCDKKKFLLTGTERDYVSWWLIIYLQRVFLEGNPYLLGVTMFVSMLHSVFDFLAFKNGKPATYYIPKMLIEIIWSNHMLFSLQISSFGTRTNLWKDCPQSPSYWTLSVSSSSSSTYLTMTLHGWFWLVLELASALSSGK